MGALAVPQIDLKKVQSSGFFYDQRRENGRGCIWKTQEAGRVSLMTGMSICKTKQELLA